jgi:hypothetical protein
VDGFCDGLRSFRNISWLHWLLQGSVPAVPASLDWWNKLGLKFACLGSLWETDPSETERWAICCVKRICSNIEQYMAGGLDHLFPYIGINHPNWLIFFRGLKPPTRYMGSWKSPGGCPMCKWLSNSLLFDSPVFHGKKTSVNIAKNNSNKKKPP